MEQNIGIWDFGLSAEDTGTVSKLDLEHCEIVGHNSPKFVKRLHGLKIHE